MRQWLKRKRLILAAVGLLILVAFGLWVYLRSSSDSAPGILEASGRIEGDQASDPAGGSGS